MNDKPVWRTILSVALCLFAVVRIAMTCSKTSRNSYSDSYNNDMSSLLSQSARYGNSSRYEDGKVSEEKSNDLFYQNYDSINKLSETERENYGVIQLKKDSAIALDILSKITVKAGSFVQKNYDDSLYIAIKQPDETSIFMHNYDSKDDLLTNFKSVKRKHNLENLKYILDKPESKFLTYSYKDKGKKNNGSVLLAAENGQFTSVAFENNKIPKAELEAKAYAFVIEMAK